MKATRLVHPSYARTILSEVDAARLRQQGWLELAETPPVSRGATWQRRYRERCQDAGMKQFTARLSRQDYDALMAVKRPGESNADLLDRLVKLLHS